MYFTKAVVDVTAGKDRARRFLNNGYTLHKQIWQLFPDKEKRDFLFRQVDETSIPTVYVVSKTAPEDKTGVWSLSTKDYQPRLSAGNRYAFTLRANPVVSRKAEGESRGTRHDVIMDAKKRKPDCDPRELEQVEGLGWLEKRAKGNGFVINSLQVDGYRQHRLSKRSENNIRFSTVDFNGVLEVGDVTAFLGVLHSGIGPAKAFGCGLLMIKKF